MIRHKIKTYDIISRTVNFENGENNIVKNDIISCEKNPKNFSKARKIVADTLDSNENNIIVEAIKEVVEIYEMTEENFIKHGKLVKE